MTDESTYITVTDLTYYLKNKFDEDPNLNHTVYLSGEISNYRRRPQHQYFNIKDENATINAVCFASRFKDVKFDLENGMKVLVCGKISLYPKNGQYQIYVDRIEPTGIGQLYQAIEQRKHKLESEGLFDDAHKQVLPKYPKRIAVVTSPSGAVIRDIIKTVKLRDPVVQIVLYPASVQGEYAPASLTKQLQRVINSNAYDTVIIGRGGGSFEDLNAFNDETLARLIYNCPIPIISSVGHQTDFTIADYVADRRAATPTAAAEFAVPERNQLLNQFDQYEQSMINYVQSMVQHKSQRVEQLEISNAMQRPQSIIQHRIDRVADLKTRLTQTMNSTISNATNQITQLDLKLTNVDPIEKAKQQRIKLDQLMVRLQQVQKNYLVNKLQQLQNYTQLLNNLNPQQIMQRGYVFTTTNDQIIKNSKQVKPGDQIVIHFADGDVTTTVNIIEPTNGKE